MKRTDVKTILTGAYVGKQVKTMGWVRTFRNDMFIALNDGSTVRNLQCVVPEGMLAPTRKYIPALACPSPGKWWKARAKDRTTRSSLCRGNTRPGRSGGIPAPTQSPFAGIPARDRPPARAYQPLRGRDARTSTTAQAIHRYFASKGFFYFNAAHHHRLGLRRRRRNVRCVRPRRTTGPRNAPTAWWISPRTFSPARPT